MPFKRQAAGMLAGFDVPIPKRQASSTITSGIENEISPLPQQPIVLETNQEEPAEVPEEVTTLTPSKTKFVKCGICREEYSGKFCYFYSYT